MADPALAAIAEPVPDTSSAKALAITRMVTQLLAAALPLGTIVWAGDLMRRFGVVLYPEQFGAVMLALAVALVFLHVPAGGGRQRTRPAPWYDLLAAAVGFATFIFVAVKFPAFSQVAFRSAEGIAAAFILIPLLLEGARRTAGMPIMLVTVGFLILGISAHLLPGDLMGRQVSVERLAYYVTWNTSAILGTPTMLVITLVIAFVMFGQGLFLSGGSRFFTDISMALMGRYRGGQAKIAVIASALFGSVSGSAVANVAATGVVTIPMMKKAGFRPHVAAAIEATASTGGQILPPIMGIAAFLIAEFLQVSYAAVAIAALVPALLYFAALFIQVDLEAASLNIGRASKDEIPRSSEVMRAGWFIPLPFLLLIAGIFWLNIPLDLAALYATLAVVISGLLFGYKDERLTFANLPKIFTTTGFGMLDILMIAPLAGIVIGVLNVSGLGFTLALSLVALAGGSMLVLLFLTGGASIILGMGMPTVSVYILLATLVVPALVQVGVEPMAAHMFVFYLGMMSMITPPIAIAAFAAASIGGSNPMRTAFASVRLGWSAFVIPFLFVFSPSLLLNAGPVETAIDVGTALIAIFLISAALTGFSLRHIPAWQRLAYALAGAGLLLPLGIVGWAGMANLAGAAAAVGLLAFDWTRRRSALAATVRV